LQMTGQSGQLRAGGRVAANLGRWSMRDSDDTWTLECQPVEVNDYWLDNGTSFELRLDVGRRIWRWRDVTVSGRLTIHAVGRPEFL